MDEFLCEMARRLRVARAAVGATQAEVSEATGVSEAALSLYERGRRQPHATTLGRLAVDYGVSADWLVGLSDEMTR